MFAPISTVLRLTPSTYFVETPVVTTSCAAAGVSGIVSAKPRRISSRGDATTRLSLCLATFGLTDLSARYAERKTHVSARCSGGKRPPLWHALSLIAIRKVQCPRVGGRFSATIITVRLPSPQEGHRSSCVWLHSDPTSPYVAALSGPKLA